MKRSPTLSLLFVLMFVLAACQPAFSPSAVSSDEFFGGAAPEMEAFPESDGAKVDTQTRSGSGEDSQQGIERIVIRNASLSISVDDPVRSMQDISRMAESMGGFVVSANQYKTTNASGQEFPRADVTIRVPVERFNEVLEAIKSGAGQVLNENVTGQDVTSQYTDLQSRLRNLEEAEQQLREIMASANRTEDVLQVFNQLTNIREQIEVVKGQIQYYEQSAALSAISVGISASAASQPISIGGWEPVGVARNAFQALINTLQGLATAAIVVIIYVLPVGVLILLPFAVFFLGLRGLWRRRSKARQAPPPNPEPSA